MHRAKTQRRRLGGVDLFRSCGWTVVVGLPVSFGAPGSCKNNCCCRFVVPPRKDELGEWWWMLVDFMDCMDDMDVLC